MIGKVKGWIWTKKEFSYTKKIKPCFPILSEESATEQNKAIQGAFLAVLDIAVDNSGYLCLIQMPEGKQDFIWEIDERDAERFVEGDFIGDMKRDITLQSFLSITDSEISLDELKKVNDAMREKTGFDILGMMKFL